ncbi:LuxR C-terminal-related transcriptional regulator [Microbispora tritici]
MWPPNLRQRYWERLTGASGSEQPAGERGRAGYSLLYRYVAALLDVRLPQRDPPLQGKTSIQQVAPARRTVSASPPDNATKSSSGAPADHEDQDVTSSTRIESLLSPEHPDALATRSSLARWTGEAGDAAAARDQYAALLPIIERVHGPEHPDALATRSSLARWTGEAGDAAAARDQYAALLPIIERVQRASHTPSGPDRTRALTSRELAIASLVVSGMSSRAIAKQLTLSLRTVEIHLSHIYDKLGVTSREGLAARLLASERSQPDAKPR